MIYRTVAATPLVLILGNILAIASASEVLATVRRKPVAMVEDGGRLFVANAGSGTISVVDVPERAVVAEIAAGRSLADLSLLPGARELLALDDKAGRLVVLERSGSTLTVIDRLNVGSGPVSLVISEDGKLAVVASKWSRTLTVVALDHNHAGTLRATLARTIPLPFAPRRQVVVKGKVIVADAFGGSLAVVDPVRGVIESIRKIQAHNIGGLTPSVDGKRLILTQQYLNARADTEADDIHWGFLMTNSLRSLPLDKLLMPGADIIPGGRLDHLGEPGQGGRPLRGGRLARRYGCDLAWRSE